MSNTCKAHDCSSVAKAAGYCWKHYGRLYRTGSLDEPRRPGNGAVPDFIDRLLSLEVDGCVYWPFAAQPNGYGVFTMQGKTYRAHRYICTKVHGARDQKIEAAHECGNRLCVNPKHLAWKTRHQNQMDRVTHGTSNRGCRQWMNRLTEIDVRAIRVEVSKKLDSQRTIAQKFGVGVKTINDIARRKTWDWLP